MTPHQSETDIYALNFKEFGTNISINDLQAEKMKEILYTMN